MPAESRTTFVIATRNRTAELSAVLARLLDTTRCPIVVVDNASEDDSVAVTRNVAAAAAGRLRVVALDRNRGAVARNIGVEQSDTPYVAFCDDDSWWAPTAIDIAETVFDARPTVALLAARTVCWPQGHDDPIVGALAASPLGREPGLPGPSILGFLACSAIVRKVAFQGAGGFSPILHFRGEETLLAWDLAANGWDLCFCDALVAYHQPSASRPVNTVQDARSLRNAVLTTWLRRPVRPCLQATARLARAAARDAAHARPLGEALRRLPAVIRQRRRLPAEVERWVRVLEST